MAFREYCHRSDKRILEAGTYSVNTLESNRENLNVVDGPLRGASRETLDTMEMMNKKMEALEAKEKTAETNERCCCCVQYGHIA